MRPLLRPSTTSTTSTTSSCDGGRGGIVSSLNFVVVAVVAVVVVVLLPIASGQGDNGYRLPTFQEFLVLAPKTVRPNQVYEVHVTLSHRYYHNPIQVTAVLSRDGTEYASGCVSFSQTGTKVIQLKVPVSVRPGVHKLMVEGLVENSVVRPRVLANGSNARSYSHFQPVFHNETLLSFSSKWVSLFFMTDRAEYISPATVCFRVFAVHPDLRPASGSMTIYIRDSKGNFVRRWLQQYFNFGVYEGRFDIEYPANVGSWAMVVDAFGYRYEHSFKVRFWYERSFEINMTLPHIVYDSEWGVSGIIYDEHISGVYGYGNSTITVRLVSADGTWEPGAIVKDLGWAVVHASILLLLHTIK